MVFADLFFLFIFLPACLLCYYRAKEVRSRNIVLLVFSLIFYAWGEPTWIILLLASALVNWFLALKIDAYREEKLGRIFLAAAIVYDIFMLLVFKYSGFFVENINAVFRSSIPVPNITMPIGISFYTFQAMSYVLDVYWETVEPQEKFPRFLLYISLFPQLIAGPIVRYSVVEKELTVRKTNAIDISEGALRVIVGLAKKVIIANNLYIIVDNFFGNGGIRGMSMLGTWYVVIIYSMYVYFDFSGYSDMAIGMGRMFGFHFNENFEHPFMCKTVAEFWQRWHISLGSFFRDYLLYVPVFGQRRKYLNLFLVWFCTGMWHGASWNFVLWGLYFGFFIFFEQKLGKKRLKAWPIWWKHIYNKLVIIIGFGIFYFEDFGQLGRFFLNITGISMIAFKSGFSDALTRTSLVNNLFLIAIAVAACFPILPKVKDYFLKSRDDRMYQIGKIASTAACALLLVICAIMLVDNTNNPFLYWRF